ncbi:hypothetical protein [Streptomyces sp. VRA16 Mangrove soil]|uniref:hypothetical protein n=1 Tax=Streptomyces sp. VRA16 Mangrove soil TaxID=2817434 RepID=UPI001A9E6A12|nr:hypothetical protein [Streptomyces sp. VRA16 Mangrove soil]MBO1332765.1 hypothetical protein [Streptomyces sp. VRA16 Mangrove soil]
MYFFGAIKDSQVAIGNGAVTQTWVRSFSEACPSAAAAPDSPSPKGAASPGQTVRPDSSAHRLTIDSEATTEPAPSTAEGFCRGYLLPMLDELQGRMAELELTAEDQNALARMVRALRRTLRTSPIDMAAVTAGLTGIRAVLEPRREGVASVATGLRDDVQRGVAR